MQYTKGIFLAGMLMALALSGCPPESDLPVHAGFRALTLTGSAPLTVDFEDLSTTTESSLTQWRWNFGDGGLSSEQNPRHTYRQLGKFTVILQAESSDGFDVAVKYAYINVEKPLVGPSADFSVAPAQGLAPLRVFFRDASKPGSDPFTSWQWNFGDGAESSDRHPMHIYAFPGEYSVSLTVQTDAGNDTETKIACVRIGGAEIPVDIPSPELESLLRAALDIPDGDLMSNDLAELTELFGAGRGLSSLEGIQYCTGLTRLDLSANQIYDLLPLAGLSRLTFLDLKDNDISDLSILSSLTALTELDVTNNLITDLAPLINNPGFGAGSSLRLRGNPLGQTALCDQIPILQARGVAVTFDGNCAEGETPLMTMMRVVEDGSSCAQGAQRDVTVTLDYAGDESIRALGFTETLPEGWQFVQNLSGQVPDVVYPRDNGIVDFAWINTPEFPVSVTYQIVSQGIPAQEYVLQGHGIYRLAGPELRTETVMSAWTCPDLPLEGEGQNQIEGSLEGALEEGEGALEEGEGALEGEGSPEEGEGEGGVLPEMILTRAMNASYTPGESMDITITLQFSGSGTVTALGMREMLPAGWQFDTLLAGNMPAVYPPNGATGTLQFAWIYPGAFPKTFTYRVIAPNELCDEQHFDGVAEFRTNADSILSNHALTSISPATPCEGSSEGTLEGEGALEGEGSPEEGEGSQEGVIEGEGEDGVLPEMVLSRSMGTMVTPGESMDITITLQFSGADTVNALGLWETLPAGWQFDTLLDGNTPAVYPANGATGTLQFAWIYPGTFPKTFTYRVVAPNGLCDDQHFDGVAEFRTDGAALQSNHALNTVIPADPCEGSTEGALDGEGALEGEGNPEGMVEGESEGIPEGYPEGEGDMWLTRKMPSSYVPGESLDVKVTMQYSGSAHIINVIFTETIPSGWKFDTLISGTLPQLCPDEGASGKFDFMWAYEPAFPITFTYRVVAPEAGCNPQTFSGNILCYTFNGGDLSSDTVLTDVFPANPCEGSSEGASEGEGEAYPEGALEGEAEGERTEMQLTRTIASDYVAGETLEVTVTMQYSGTKKVKALGLYEILPPGWLFDSLGSGNIPPIYPIFGAETPAPFAWIYPPTFPASFSYRVLVPENACDSAVFGGEVMYRTDNAQLRSNYEITTVHSADPCEGDVK